MSAHQISSISDDLLIISKTERKLSLNGSCPPFWTVKICCFGHVTCVCMWFCFLPLNFNLTGKYEAEMYLINYFQYDIGPPHHSCIFGFFINELLLESKYTYALPCHICCIFAWHETKLYIICFHRLSDSVFKKFLLPHS